MTSIYQTIFDIASQWILAHSNLLGRVKVLVGNPVLFGCGGTAAQRVVTIEVSYDDTGLHDACISRGQFIAAYDQLKEAICAQFEHKRPSDPRSEGGILICRFQAYEKIKTPVPV